MNSPTSFHFRFFVFLSGLLLLTGAARLVAAPVIDTQPLAAKVFAGANVSFSVAATGTAPVTYQWQRSTNSGSTFSNLTASTTYVGPTTASLAVNATTVAMNAYQFRCVVTDATGSVTTAAVALTVDPAPGTPNFTTNPLAISIVIGGNATFTVAATGTTPMSYLWQRSTNNGSTWTNLAADANHSGTTTATLTLSNATAVMNAYRFRCVATNAVSSTTSKSATLTVTASAIPPTITTQPASATLTAGAAINFSVVAAGSSPFGYQWFLNSAPIIGANGSTYAIARATKSRAGNYTVLVSNAAGAVTSANATLIVLASTFSDFNGDGMSDVIWENTATGEHGLYLMNGTGLFSWVNLGTMATQWHMAGTGDFNEDGQADILWQNSATGERKVWLMNGTALGEEVSLGVVVTDWVIAAAGDFSGDGQTDIVWENSVTGERGIYLMNRTALSGYASLGVLSPQWHITGAGDFNGDSQCDILLQNATTGECRLWLMNGTVLSSSVSLGFLDTAARIAMIGDYNADGKPDIVWQNKTTGERYINLMDGSAVSSTASLGIVGLEWTIGPVVTVPVFVGVSGAGQASLVRQNTATGERRITLLKGAAISRETSLGTVPSDWYIAGTGDFNGDGQTDIVWENTATGERGFYLMNGNNFASWSSLGVISTAWRIVGTGDFNGDGQTDIVWENTVTGERGFYLMNGTSFAGWVGLGSIPAQWHIAATGDFNRDGQMDIMWENTTTGEHGLYLMSGTSLASWAGLGTTSVQWRVAATLDYNGDGQTDVVWENTVTGERGCFLMLGANQAGWVDLGTIPTAWRIAGATNADPGLSTPTAASDAEASRFLIQASFGPTTTAIEEVRSMGYAAWVDAQLALPPTFHMPYYQTRAAEFMARDGDTGYFTPRQEAWWQHAVTAPDQLRQRMAFALSEILVISQDSKLESENAGVTAYYDILVKHAFGNYRQLLEEVTLSPMMGSYLSMIRNRKPDPKTGSQPDENYAREIMQLFSIGLSELNLDGTLRLGADGRPIPTYTQADIVGLAHVFTGWGPYYDPANPPKWSNGTTATANDWFLWGWDPLRPMTFNTKYGDLQSRQIVRGVTVPGTLSGPQRLSLALNTLFNHPNVAPFVARHLIQRFVTSNPSPAYVRRVASAFANNGSGVRGDLGATIRAVLLDPDARNADLLGSPTFGKMVEPLMRLTRVFRSFPPGPAPHAETGDNRLFLNFVWDMSEQSPLFSPTVFNFFKPSFAQPGPISTAGLASPEFQIYNDTTAMAGANRNYGLINWGMWVDEPVDGSRLDLDLREPLGILTAAGRTHTQAQAALVEYFNRRLLGGGMSTFLRQKLLDTYASLPKSFGYSTASELERVQLGLYLVMFSPEFNIQR